MILYNELTIAHVTNGKQLDVSSKSGLTFRVRRIRAKPPYYLAKLGNDDAGKVFADSIADLRVALGRL